MTERWNKTCSLLPWSCWRVLVWFEGWLCSPLLCVQSAVNGRPCRFSHCCDHLFALLFVFFDLTDHLCVFWQNNHSWHCACVPWASLHVSCPTNRSLCIASLFPLSCGSWVSITAQPVRPGLGSTACCLWSYYSHLWECSPPEEHPEGASRGKGPLANPKSTPVCPTWSRFVQGQMPCGRQSTALPTAALSQAYRTYCVASCQSLFSDSGQIKFSLCSWVLKARLVNLIPAWDW